jgi:hypothetical protein
MIGKKLSPILVEIEETLWNFEAHSGTKPEYTLDGFRASIKIFMSALMDKMWELQGNENLSIDDRLTMAKKLGDEVRKLVKVHTDIDTRTLYEQE